MRGLLWPALLLVALAVGPAEASGSYVFRPVQAAAHDAVQYELGKAIFTGKAALPREIKIGAGERESRERRLASLNQQLPARVRQGSALTGLAARITAAQMGALEYYLKVRYKVQ